MSTYLARQKWDRKKRPERLVVEIDPSFWQSPRQNQRELQTNVAAFMREVRQVHAMAMARRRRA